MSLSVCILPRNEEKNIAQVVRSVQGLADQVLVCDTGSTDRTAAVAAECGAEVHVMEWHDDFAEGSNFALDRATGDWILWLNPNEELPASYHPLVRACMARADAFAYGVFLQQLSDPEQPERYTETVELRLYRKHPEVRYRGRTQPTFAVPLQQIAQQEQKQIYPSEIRILRHARGAPLTESKLRWATRLLELELQDRPGQLHYLIEYGRNLLLLNDPKGHEVLADATEQVLPLRDAPNAPVASVQQLLEYLMTVSPEQSRSRLSPAEACELAVRWFPFTPPMLWRAAEHYFRSGDFRRASQRLEELVNMGQTGAYDRSQAFDPSILGDPALFNLGVCHVQLKDLDKAERCFLQLITSKTHQAQALQQLGLVQELRRRAAEDKNSFWVSGST